MLCKHCGNEMPDDAIFCSHCGTKLFVAEPEPEQPKEPEVKEPAVSVKPAEKPAEEPPRKPFLEEMQWDVSEYPDSNVIEKTEDINFDWNTDPDSVPDHEPRRPQVTKRPDPKPLERKSAEAVRVAEIFDRVVPAEESKAAVEGAVEEVKDTGFSQMDKFSTFNRKNAEFQELLDKEYEKIRDAGTIGREQSQADVIAKEKFDSRQEEMTMDQFLEKEGAVKLYEPKPLESDVLARIEAQEKQRARQKAEEEARAKALEEARAEAEAKKKAEIARLNSEEEASAAAAEEIRLAEEEEIRQRTEAEAKRRAEAEAAHLEAIAKRKAQQEEEALRLEEQRQAEEARLKAEAEEKAKEEAIAKAKAEAEAARAAEEEARRKAEAELNAAREAAKIRAQQEASAAAREEARFKEEQERRRYEEEALRQKQALKARQQEREENANAVEAEVRDALEQTARMREEEEAKIKAALAGIRSGRFSDTISAGEPEPAPVERKTQPVVIPKAEIEQALAHAAAEEAAPAEEPAAEVAEPVAEAEPTLADALEALIDAPEEAPEAEAEAPAEAVEEIPEAPAEEAPAEIAEEAPAAEPVATAAEEIEEAHRKTQSQIDEMAKARQTFFEDFPDAEELMAKTEPGLGQTRMVDKDALMADIDSTKKISREELQAAAAAELAGAAPGAREIGFKEQLSEIDDLLSQFASVNKAEQAIEPQVSDVPFEEPAAEPVFETAPETEPEPAFAPAEEGFGTEGTMFEAPDAVMQDAQEDTDFIDEIDAAVSEIPTEIPAAEPVFEPAEVPAEAAEAVEAAAEAAGAEAVIEEVQEAVKEVAPEAEIPAAEEAPASEKPGLEDTMVMPISRTEIADAIPEEAEDLAAEEALSPKEQKKLEKARAKEAKARAKEEKKAAKAAVVEDTFGEEEYEEEPQTKSSVGRTILLIILIILCIIFALELAGIGIKLLAPTSSAAEFIDNILNSLIHMITG